MRVMPETVHAIIYSMRKSICILFALFQFILPPCWAAEETQGTRFTFGDASGLYWLPKSATISSVVLCVHGISGSAAGYEDLAHSLTNAGMATYAMEVRGCGYKGAGQKQWSKLNLKASRSDLKNTVDELRSLYPGKPIYLIGE